ncbi:MAG: hypothetical protein NTV22_15215 [bacterium]|nr:hypothetical protein [bacterium]
MCGQHVELACGRLGGDDRGFLGLAKTADIQGRQRARCMCARKPSGSAITLFLNVRVQGDNKTLATRRTACSTASGPASAAKSSSAFSVTKIAGRSTAALHTLVNSTAAGTLARQRVKTGSARAYSATRRTRAPCSITHSTGIGRARQYNRPAVTSTTSTVQRMITRRVPITVFFFAAK